MVAKKNKLPVQSFIKKKGTGLKSPHVLIRVFKGEKAYSRVGAVVSRKVAPKATVRNRLRRVVFNYFNANLDQLPVRDYLVVLLGGVDRVNNKEITKELEKLLK